MLKIKTFPIVASLSLLAGLLSCSEEETYTYPSLLSEFADVYSGSDGRLTHLQTDDGRRLEILNVSAISAEGVVADTVYRSLVRYEPKETGGAEVYTIQMIAAPQPKAPSDFAEGVKGDPLEMQSIWRGGDYLNMIFLVKAQNGRHTFRFVDEGITSSLDGVKTLHFRLYHDAGDDVQAYTQKAYLSLPLASYKPILYQGDTLSLSIPTTEGWQRWTRCY